MRHGYNTQYYAYRGNTSLSHEEVARKYNNHSNYIISKKIFCITCGIIGFIVLVILAL